MRLADKIFERLKSEVGTVFLVPGGGAAHLVDALGLSGIEYVACQHEQAAGMAAIGYAMIHGFAVCLVTSGPGSLNAVAACGAAWMDSYGVLFISGQANSTTLVGDTGLRTRGVQEVDIIPVVEPITKYAHQMTRRDGLEFLDAAIRIAKEGRRGPCWLSIPLDVQGAECNVL